VHDTFGAASRDAKVGTALDVLAINPSCLEPIQVVNDKDLQAKQYA
jgi:hypothetical protein